MTSYVMSFLIGVFFTIFSMSLVCNQTFDKKSKDMYEAEEPHLEYLRHTNQGTQTFLRGQVCAEMRRTTLYYVDFSLSGEIQKVPVENVFAEAEKQQKPQRCCKL
jgi:hypothetical protein